jgi:hypothetical protein
MRAVLGGAVLLGPLRVLGKPLLPPRRLWSGARAGVQVRVLVDAAGSLFSFSRDLGTYLRQHE